MATTDFTEYAPPDTLALWSKYEDIAMHFNDLLMRLRTQALAGIAAISTLVGIFSKENALQLQSSWLVAGYIFAGLSLFWVAIAVLDLGYYNRLLMSAVAALVALEKGHEGPNGPGRINMSTIIQLEFTGSRQQRKKLNIHSGPNKGVAVFYLLVFFVIAAGSFLSFRMHDTAAIASSAQKSVLQEQRGPTAPQTPKHANANRAGT